MIKPFLAVCLGGAAGSGARFLVVTWTLARFGPASTAGTFAVNIVGSFLMGMVAAAFDAKALSPLARQALATGVLGGFTTYSAFNHETARLFETGSWKLAAANVTATLLGCLFAGFAGLALVRWGTGSPVLDLGTK